MEADPQQIYDMGVAIQQFWMQIVALIMGTAGAVSIGWWVKLNSARYTSLESRVTTLEGKELKIVNCIHKLETDLKDKMSKDKSEIFGRLDEIADRLPPKEK